MTTEYRASLTHCGNGEVLGAPPELRSGPDLAAALAGAVNKAFGGATGEEAALINKSEINTCFRDWNGGRLQGTTDGGPIVAVEYEKREAATSDEDAEDYEPAGEWSWVGAEDVPEGIRQSARQAADRLDICIREAIA